MTEINQEKTDNSSDVTDTSLIITLPPKVQRFIQLYVTGQYTLNKLAQLLEVHPNTLTNWMRKKEVKDAIDEIQTSTHDMVAVQLKALTFKAANKLGNLIDSPIDGVALQAVKDVLDRGGHKSKQEIKIDKTVRTFEERLNTLIDESMVDYNVEEEE
jgi:hypothetical protein